MVRRRTRKNETETTNDSEAQYDEVRTEEHSLSYATSTPTSADSGKPRSDAASSRPNSASETPKSRIPVAVTRPARPVLDVGNISPIQPERLRPASRRFSNAGRTEQPPQAKTPSPVEQSRRATVRFLDNSATTRRAPGSLQRFRSDLPLNLIGPMQRPPTPYPRGRGLADESFTPDTSTTRSRTLGTEDTGSSPWGIRSPTVSGSGTESGESKTGTRQKVRPRSTF